MDLQENPPRMYKNFDTLIAVGENPSAQEDLKKVDLEENVDES